MQRISVRGFGGDKMNGELSVCIFFEIHTESFQEKLKKCELTL